MMVYLKKKKLQLPTSMIKDILMESIKQAIIRIIYYIIYTYMYRSSDNNHIINYVRGFLSFESIGFSCKPKDIDNDVGCILK